MLTEQDVNFMKLAIEAARKSKSESHEFPRPKVGAVVVSDEGEFIGSAFRGELGDGEHAEYTLLDKKLIDDTVAGSTVYATLEPCTTRNHPKVPCAQRLIDRKVKRVVIGMLDPNQAITGKGILHLRKHGIEVDLFPNKLMAQLEDLNRDFTKHFDSEVDYIGVFKTLGINPEGPWQSIARLHDGEQRCTLLTEQADRAELSLRTTRFSKRSIGSAEKSRIFIEALNRAIYKLDNLGPVKRIICLNDPSKIDHIASLEANHKNNHALSVYWTESAHPYELFIVDGKVAFIGLTFPGINDAHKNDWWLEVRDEKYVNQLVQYYDDYLCPKSDKNVLKEANQSFKANWRNNLPENIGTQQS